MINRKFYTKKPAKTMEEEIWKDIIGFEGKYKVSNLGRVKSIDRTVMHTTSGLTQLSGKILKPGRSTNGYLTVVLYVDYKKKTHTVHRLIAIAFLGATGKDYVNHIDGNKENNVISNLELVTFRENVCHRFLTLNKKSKYIGVSQSGGKWRACININNRKISLGQFHTQEEAHAAYVDASASFNIKNRYIK